MGADTQRMAWLDSLQPGSAVACMSRLRDGWDEPVLTYAHGTVERRTPTQILVRWPHSETTRHRNSDGSAIGSDGMIEPATPETAARSSRVAKLVALRQTMSRAAERLDKGRSLVKLDSKSDEQLDELSAALNRLLGVL